MQIQCSYPLESPARGYSDYDVATPKTPSDHHLISQEAPESPWWVTKLVTSVSGYLMSEDSNKENRDSNTISLIN